MDDFPKPRIEEYKHCRVVFVYIYCVSALEFQDVATRLLSTSTPEAVFDDGWGWEWVWVPYGVPKFSGGPNDGGGSAGLAVVLGRRVVERGDGQHANVVYAA